MRPDENIEDHVSKLYSRIESPVMTGLQIRFDFDQVRVEQGNPINRIYPRESGDLFAGEQLVLVGRYKKPGTAKVVVTGSVGSRKEKFDFAATLTEKSSDESSAFVEKLWAVRRVGEILDELDLKGKNEELVKELVELATRHGILTPYTSFMADDGTNLHDLAGNASMTSRRLDALAQTGGAGGVAQRSFKGQMQRAALAPRGRRPRRRTRSVRLRRGRRRALAPAPSPGQSLGGQVAEEAKAADKNVRNIGNRTFFRREGQWIDSRVTQSQQQNARRVKQFSPEYFALARQYGRTMSQYLAFDEPVVLNLDNQAYLIEP